MILASMNSASRSDACCDNFDEWDVSGGWNVEKTLSSSRDQMCVGGQVLFIASAETSSPSDDQDGKLDTGSRPKTSPLVSFVAFGWPELTQQR